VTWASGPAPKSHHRGSGGDGQDIVSHAVSGFLTVV